MIDGAELVLYTDDGQNATIDLSPTQLKVIIKLLYITPTEDGQIAFATDEWLNKKYFPKESKQ